jgi:two-component system, OmpR family, response regulator
LARVLVVDDDATVREVVVSYLRAHRHDVVEAADGEAALTAMRAGGADLVVLDLMLPGIDGIEVCRRLRGDGVWSPILMLTARDGVRDRVAGLDSGADDYLVKPFSYAELLARLRALARRGGGDRPTELQVGDLRLDPATRKVRRGEREIELSAKEFAVLEVFMRRPGEVLSRFQLLEHAWDYEYENRSNIVDSYVRFLRRKVDKPFGVRSIETVRGAGYRLREDGGRTGGDGAG